MRFTKNIAEETLRLNEGYSAYTFNSQKNFEDNRTYTITDGKVICHSEGKAPFTGRFDETFECDHEATLRFLREHKDELVLPEV